VAYSLAPIPLQAPHIVPSTRERILSVCGKRRVLGGGGEFSQGSTLWLFFVFVYIRVQGLYGKLERREYIVK